MGKHEGGGGGVQKEYSRESVLVRICGVREVMVLSRNSEKSGVAGM